jgi:proteasome lid subunit RPN8/RPN11
MRDAVQTAILSSDTLNTLLECARESMPNEMCGLLFSNERFTRCPNSALDPTRTFELSYRDYAHACLFFEEQPWAIVHSHPGKSAALSSKDCSLMDALYCTERDWACIIVGLDPVEVRCWRKVGELYTLEWCHRQTECVLQRP